MAHPQGLTSASQASRHEASDQKSVTSYGPTIQNTNLWGTLQIQTLRNILALFSLITLGKLNTNNVHIFTPLWTLANRFT